MKLFTFACTSVGAALVILALPLAAPAESAAPAAKKPAAQSEACSRCRFIDESQAASSDARIRINAMLSQPLQDVGLQYTDKPLESVVNFISSDYDIPIQIDRIALEDAGLSPDESITINVQSISLRSALRLMLQPLELTYTIENEVLMITTLDEAELHLAVCVYDVRDLVDIRNGEIYFDELMDVIVSTVAIDTWAENGGGEAEIRPLHPGLLVISQTQAIHEKIADLLKTIRTLSPQDSERTQGRGDFGGYGGEYGGRGGYGGYGSEYGEYGGESGAGGSEFESE